MENIGCSFTLFTPVFPFSQLADNSRCYPILRYLVHFGMFFFRIQNNCFNQTKRTVVTWTEIQKETQASGGLLLNKSLNLTSLTSHFVPHLTCHSHLTPYLTSPLLTSPLTPSSPSTHTSHLSLHNLHFNSHLAPHFISPHLTSPHTSLLLSSQLSICTFRLMFNFSTRVKCELLFEKPNFPT